MAYKIVALDLDGTLLDDHRGISARNRAAVRAAVEAGVLVVLTTGRPLAGMRQYCDMLELTGPVITTGGAVTHDRGTGQVLDSLPIPHDLAREIIHRLQQRNYYLQLYREGNRYLCERVTRYSPVYTRLIGMQPQEMGDFLSLPDVTTFKILSVDSSDRCASMVEYVSEAFGDRVMSKRSFPFFAEVYHKEATKGCALHRLATRLGVKQSEVMAVGDSGIDLSMVEYAGLGVAMANATKEMLEVADTVTASNIEDGVAQAIEKYIL